MDCTADGKPDPFSQEVEVHSGIFFWMVRDIEITEYLQIFEFGQFHHQFVGESLCKIGDFRIPDKVLERKYRNVRFH